MDDEGQVELGGEVEEAAPGSLQRRDVRLDHGGLNFQPVERILGVELAQLAELSSRLAHGIEDGERNGVRAEIRIEFV